MGIVVGVIIMVITTIIILGRLHQPLLPLDKKEKL
jgi:hypothetical protein